MGSRTNGGRGGFADTRAPSAARLILGLALAMAFCVLMPWRASAHSILVSSQPAAGSQLGTTPGTVVLTFSEPIDLSLSNATVIDPSGHPTTAKPDAATEVRLNLVTNLPGLYRVGWASISLDDGHTLRGNFTFTVLARASSATNGASSGGLGPGDVALAGARWVEDVSLLLAVGMLLIAWLGRRDPALEWVRPKLILAMTCAVVAGVIVVSTESLSAAGGALPGVSTYFTSGPAGLARIVRVLLELFAIAAVRARARTLWPAITAPILALAAAGHAQQVRPVWFGIAIDAGHLVAAGTWAGGIMAMATLRPPAGWRTDGRVLLSRFTPYALTAFAIMTVCGGLQAIQNVGTLSALTGSDYGRVLLSKIALIGLMIPLSLMAWRLRRPRLRIEGGVAIAVVLAAALLASFPLPPSRAAAAPSLPSTGAAAGLPHGSELTLGDHAGQVLVGMTVTPAMPGSNQLRFYVLSLKGDAASAALGVSATVNGNPVVLTSCSDTCRTTEADLHGQDVVTVSVAGNGAGTAGFQLPSLPAADGSALVVRAQQRMDGLHSYVMKETLTSGGATTITTTYTAVAPDRESWTLDNGSSTIWIGSTRYSRDTVGGAWTTEAGGVSAQVPAYVWDSFSPYVGVHVLRSEAVDGIPTTVVGFFGGTPGTPVWFQFWIDDSGLVHRAQMRAPGHYMDEMFTQFDASLSITAPG